MLIEGRVLGRSSEVPAQAGALTYTVTSVEGANRITLRNQYPEMRPVFPIDANDPLAYPDLKPAEVNSTCLLRRRRGSISLWQVKESPAYGPCAP